MYDANRLFVIVKTAPEHPLDCDLFWSSTQGWVPWECCWDCHTFDERSTITPPANGRWAEIDPTPPQGELY
jgi:hypothetical protein